MQDNPGICGWFDARTKTDYGHSCPRFKAIRYIRNKAKKDLEVELEK